MQPGERSNLVDFDPFCSSCAPLASWECDGNHHFDTRDIGIDWFDHLLLVVVKRIRLLGIAQVLEKEVLDEIEE